MAVNDFVVKDSGAREQRAGGFVRDTEEGKPDLTLVPREGIRRYAEHLTKGAVKYGKHNWRLSHTLDDKERFLRSAARHFNQYLDGEMDEDHVSAVKFNLDAAEYVRAILMEETWALRILQKTRGSYDLCIGCGGKPAECGCAQPASWFEVPDGQVCFVCPTALGCNDPSHRDDRELA